VKNRKKEKGITMNKSDAQKLTELLGGCWHERDWTEEISTTMTGLNCRKCEKFVPFSYKHPTYSNPKDILEKMKQFCGIHKFRNFIYQLSDDCCEDTIMFVETYILNPPALLRKAIEFLETNNEKSI
jgi:hypothetical protein